MVAGEPSSSTEQMYYNAEKYELSFIRFYYKYRNTCVCACVCVFACEYKVKIKYLALSPSSNLIQRAAYFLLSRVRLGIKYIVNK